MRFKLILVAVSICQIDMNIASASAKQKLNPEKIEALTGLKGNYNEKEAVFKVSFPRGDIKSVASGAILTPALGLTSWAAFTESNGQVMMMGDTVLTEDQVNPVMSVALDNGLEVTALHNHFFYDAPKVMFMHISGMGSEEKLARAVGKVYEKLKDTIANKVSFQTSTIDPSKTTLHPEIIQKNLPEKGEMKDGVYKVVIGRETKMHGKVMGAAMGVNTWAAFAGSDDEALVDGDFAMKENELQAVLRSLRSHHLNIVAIHNHMTEESPRMVFLHFWGIGSLGDLSKGIRAALDVQKQ